LFSARYFKVKKELLSAGLVHVVSPSFLSDYKFLRVLRPEYQLNTAPVVENVLHSSCMPVPPGGLNVTSENFDNAYDNDFEAEAIRNPLSYLSCEVRIPNHTQENTTLMSNTPQRCR